MRDTRNVGSIRAAIPLLAVLAVAASPRPADGFDAGGAEAPFAVRAGGSGDDDARAVVVGPDGAIYVAGVTSSTDFPASGALQGSAAGGTDIFVTKIAADGATVLFSTMFGGTGDDEAAGIALDASGRIWIAGRTESGDFPVIGALQPDIAGGSDGFVACLSADGDSLDYATYLGGNGDDAVAALALDGSGNVWVVGETEPVGELDALEFPLPEDLPPPEDPRGIEGFAACLSSDGSSLLYASFLGGSGDDRLRAVAVDASGAVFVAGDTLSDDLPVIDAFQAGSAGGSDAFVAKIDAVHSLVFLTYLGGSGNDMATGIALDPSGRIWVSGVTDSRDFPSPSGPALASAGGTDAFVAELDAGGSFLQRSLLLGGAGDDAALALAVDGDGAVVAAGTTDSPDFPVADALQPSHGGGTDAFVARLSSSEAEVTFASYLGGAGDDSAAAVALRAPGMAILAGTAGPGDPAAVVPSPAGPGGGRDALVARFASALAPPTNLQFPSITHLHITMTWLDATGGAAAFEVQRRSGADPWETMALLPPGTTSWTDESVLPATTYHYRVRAWYGTLRSPFLAGDAVVTAADPVWVPAAPGSVSAVAESPRRVRVRWEDRSEAETAFEVYRSVDGGPMGYVKSLGAGATQWLDGGVGPDRTWSYMVRAVGVSGASAFVGPVPVETPSTLTVELIKGKRVDGARVGRDSVDIQFRLARLGEGAPLDIRAAGIRIGVGAEDGNAIFAVLPGDTGWKERRGVFTWKSPRGSVTKATLVVNTVKGTIRLKASRLQLAPATANEMRFWVRCGDEAGSNRDAWAANRKGTTLKF